MNACYPSCNVNEYCDCRPVPWPGERRRSYISTIRNGFLVKRRIPALLTYGAQREVSMRTIEWRHAQPWLIRACQTVYRTGKPHYMLRNGDVFKVTP